MKERLKKQWPTPKISFTYATCPLCNVWVDHSEVQGAMRQVHALRRKVEASAMERFRIEGLAKPAPAAPAAAGGHRAPIPAPPKKHRGKGAAAANAAAAVAAAVAVAVAVAAAAEDAKKAVGAPPAESPE